MGLCSSVATTFNTPLLTGGPASVVWCWILGACMCFTLGACVCSKCYFIPPARWSLRALVRGPLIRESKNFEYGDDRIDGAAQSPSLKSCVDGRGDWCRALDFYSDAPACSASEWRHAVRHGTLCRAGVDTSQHSPSVFCGCTRGSTITDNAKRTPDLCSLELHPCQNRARFPGRACTMSFNDGLVLWIDICASECSQARGL